MSDQKTDKECTVRLECIIQKKKMTAWMQACDVFEKSKVIVEMSTLEINVSPIVHLKDKKIKNLIEGMLKFEDDDIKFIFIHVDQITYLDGDAEITEKNKARVVPVFDRNIRCISDGSKWSTLVEVVKSKGFDVKTTDDMFIEEILPKQTNKQN